MPKHGDIRFVPVRDGHCIESYAREEPEELIAYLLECGEVLIVQNFVHWVEADPIRAHRWILASLEENKHIWAREKDRIIEEWIQDLALKGLEKLSFHDMFARHTLEIVKQTYAEDLEEWF